MDCVTSRGKRGGRLFSSAVARAGYCSRVVAVFLAPRFGKLLCSFYVELGNFCFRRGEI